MYKSFMVLFLAIAIVTILLGADVPPDFNHSGREQMQKAKPNNLISDANNVSITVVYDNNPYKERLETSWGFSCVVTGTEKTVLFDTGGNGQLLLENMSKTGIDVNSIETVVLSHIHGDHTGGLEMFLKKNPKVSAYLPKSFPKRFKERITSVGAKIVEVDKKTEICKNVYSTGQMGKLIKEQGLILQTPKGLVIITGCAHPGIVKMVKTAKDLFDDKILLVMGGFHLEWATKNKIESIIKAFEDMNVKYTGPCHCTGEKARLLFSKHFGDNYINVGVGRVIRIKDLK
jgi:7,8-dihydropterin-6-yl-methyl-4-(beta-D-ribofuranosyl)aminobenzene 5'-phosphate synthase